MEIIALLFVLSSSVLRGINIIAAVSARSSKFSLLFFLLIIHWCGTPASWAAHHTTMRLIVKVVFNLFTTIFPQGRCGDLSLAAMTPGHHRAVHVDTSIDHNDPSLKYIWSTSMEKVLNLCVGFVIFAH